MNSSKERKNKKLVGLKCLLYLFYMTVIINTSVCIKRGSVLCEGSNAKLRNDTTFTHLSFLMYVVALPRCVCLTLSSVTIPAKWCIRTCAACLYLSWLMGCFHVLLCAPMRNHCVCGFGVRSAILNDRLECTSWQCICFSGLSFISSTWFFHTVTIMLW